MSESFYMSNMSPQEPSFNRGIWKKLESTVRNWAVKEDTIYVVTGGVLSSSKGSIGPNRVTVPEYYYKVIYDPTGEKKMIALVLPNKKCTKHLQVYVVSVDHIENITGIDFSPALPDKLENNLESNVTAAKWSFESSSYNRKTGKKKYHTDKNNKININTASAAELDRLYGIGPAKAKAIIAARPYNSVDELTKAYGIGDATLGKIRDYITVGDKTKAKKKSTSSKINIDTASCAELESLPGIVEVLAGKIISVRPFRNIHKIKNVTGIGPKTFEKVRWKISTK